MGKTIEIDGSQGEGGGQILRTSLALSLITGKTFHLRNIRARRSKPGLQAQHLMCVRAAQEIGNAQVRGARLQSIDLVFEPGNVRAGDYAFSIGTAGATSLVLHTVYLPLALAGQASSVTITGGTHVKASPCFHFLARIWAMYLKAIGIDITLTMERAGFYPRGGGCIHARIEPATRILPFQGMTSARVSSAIVLSGSAGLPAHVCQRMADRARDRLTALDLNVEVHQQTWSGGPGCMLGIELPTEPAPTFFFALGERGKPAEAVAQEAVDQVENFLQIEPLAVDEHTSDQLLLPLALATEPSEFRVCGVSSHLRTNAGVIEQFLDRPIQCEDSEADGVVKIQ